MEEDSLRVLTGVDGSSKLRCVEGPATTVSSPHEGREEHVAQNCLSQLQLDQTRVGRLNFS